MSDTEERDDSEDLEKMIAALSPSNQRLVRELVIKLHPAQSEEVGESQIVNDEG